MAENKFNIPLFTSLFKGREDLFALRWEKGNKKGYMPAYYYDPYRYKIHKIHAGSFQNFPDKKFLAMSESQILKHLEGQLHIGIYPLLKDNTSWFIVADFDDGGWMESATNFMKGCEKKDVPCYLERSRSGNGGHVWIFFERPIEASKSRKVMLDILIETGCISAFDKESSFDRLFPNQDILSGKGFGNLIALPLNGISIKDGNSSFIDSKTLLADENQWHFLSSVKRVSKTHIENLYNALVSTDKIYQTGVDLFIQLSGQICIRRSAISPKLFTFLKEQLNFSNSDYFVKKQSGRNTFGTQRYFRMIEEHDGNVYIPKGFVGRLIRFCRENNITYHLKDERKLKKEVLYSFSAELRPFQIAAIEQVWKKDQGVIVAPPGSGKTVMALKVVQHMQQPTLVLVHRKQLVDQWKERIESFLGIPSRNIGKISSKLLKMDSNITVATFQSLSKIDINSIANSFGLVIVDECHHIPAETFRNVLQKINSKYLYGLTATPFRKNNDDRLINVFLGDVIAEILPEQTGKNTQVKICVRNTELNIPFNPKIDQFETVSHILIHDTMRSGLILKDIEQEVRLGKKCVVLTERKDHIDTLNQYLKKSYITITLNGEDTPNSRTIKWKSLQDGNYQILITTGQFFGEGMDLPNASVLFLAYPFSFHGKLIQYIGRVQRSEEAPTVYDYRDIRMDYLNKMFLKRNLHYRKLQQQQSLFDFPLDEHVEMVEKDAKDIFIEKEIKVRLAEIEFLYGSVQFVYQIAEAHQELTFSIEQINIRPEFEVLKPYFEKLLQSKYLHCKINIVINNKGDVEALSAVCPDLEKINKEVIESLKFRYIERNIHANGSYLGTVKNREESETQVSNLYNSDEDILTDILSKGSYRHKKQLQYLSRQHIGTILKIRFMLEPFSFIFLLNGKTQYHIVWETLDTDEATYVWYMQKDADLLGSNLHSIQEQLNQIRNNGRQKFLENPPNNFSKILHDYSEELKGFVIWKDQLDTLLW